MHTIQQAYKAFKVLTPAAITDDLAASASNDVIVEGYQKDAMVTLNVGACAGTSVTGVFALMGALKATPTTFDQTLATFGTLTEASDNTIACAAVNLEGIYAVAPALACSEVGDESFTVGMVLHAKADNQGATLNSSTPA